MDKVDAAQSASTASRRQVFVTEVSTSTRVQPGRCVCLSAAATPSYGGLRNHEGNSRFRYLDSKSKTNWKRFTILIWSYLW
jgi:hypothetical protein